MGNPSSRGNKGTVIGPTGAQFALLVAVILLTACGLVGGSDQTSAMGDQTRLEINTEATLTCSQECADRGWCGETADQRPVVLGNAIDPSAAGHDRVFQQDTLVNIDFVAMATIEQVVDGTRSQLPFYHVSSLNDGKSAWIAGWCISAP